MTASFFFLVQAVLARPEGIGNQMSAATGPGSRNFLPSGQQVSPAGSSSEPLYVTVKDMGWKQNVSCVAGLFRMTTAMLSARERDCMRCVSVRSDDVY